MKKFLKSLIVAICSPLFEKMGFTIISKEEHYTLLNDHQVAIRANEAQRWFNEFRADLMPLWMFIWGKNGLTPVHARDHYRKAMEGDIPKLKKSIALL